MGQFVTTGAALKCSFGTTPSTFTATSAVKVMVEGKVVGTLRDSAGGVNIAPFGMCTSIANPTVAAATAAALGVLTPQPCIPQIAGTWIPSGAKVIIAGAPCLTSDCTAMCAWAGGISIVSPGQVKART